MPNQAQRTPLTPEFEAPQTLLPFRKLETAPNLSGSVLFFDRVLRPSGSEHVFIGLRAARTEAEISFKGQARQILERNWQDTGHLRADLMRAMVTSLYQYVPEYALAAAPTNPEGAPEKMPCVVLSFNDGRQLNLGRPDGSGVLSAAFAENSGISYKYPAKKPERFMPSHENEEPWRKRRLDHEFVGQFDPEWDNDALGPIVDVFAAVLAATVDSRREVQNIREIRAARGEGVSHNCALQVGLLPQDFEAERRQYMRRHTQAAAQVSP